MTPVEFEQSNITYAKDQPEYQPLPAHVDSSHQIATTCWEFTDEEIELLRTTKRIWLQQYIFGQALQPQLPAVECPLMR